MVTSTFPAVLFIMLCMRLLAIVSADEISDHSNETASGQSELLLSF